MTLINDIILSQTDRRPMYQQIMDQVKQLVAVGDWAPGEPIPSIRQLAVALKISVITVKRAYLELEREGVIVTRHGKGSSVAEQPESSRKVPDAELRRHLGEAVRLARRLGLGFDELVSRLLEAYNESTEESQ